jgi:hypothetical protein
MSTFTVELCGERWTGLLVPSGWELPEPLVLAQRVELLTSFPCSKHHLCRNANPICHAFLVTPLPRIMRLLDSLTDRVLLVSMDLLSQVYGLHKSYGQTCHDEECSTATTTVAG